jgi:hypothetical protein
MKWFWHSSRINYVASSQAELLHKGNWEMVVDGIPQSHDCKCFLYVGWTGMWGNATLHMTLVSRDAKSPEGPGLDPAIRPITMVARWLNKRDFTLPRSLSTLNLTIYNHSQKSLPICAGKCWDPATSQVWWADIPCSWYIAIQCSKHLVVVAILRGRSEIPTSAICEVLVVVVVVVIMLIAALPTNPCVVMLSWSGCKRPGGPLVVCTDVSANGHVTHMH